MAKKTVVVPDVKISSAIDMRVTKNDVIELMISEESERLSAHYKSCTEALASFRKEASNRAVESFKVNQAHLIKAFVAYCGGEPQFSQRHNDLYFYVNNQSNCYHNSIGIKLLPEDVKKLEVLEKNLNDANEACIKFRQQEKKGRIAMVRKLLEQSEEGRAVLAKVNEVKSQLLLPSSK